MGLNLNTNVYHTNRYGVKEITTVRGIIRLGHGKAYDALKASPNWLSILANFNAEQEDPLGAISEKVRLAHKKFEKAAWWYDEGLSVHVLEYNREASSHERKEAFDEYKAAEEELRKCRKEHELLIQRQLREGNAAETLRQEARIQQAVAKRAEVEAAMRSEWEAFNYEASKDSWSNGVHLARVGRLGATLPYYPWPNCKAQRSVTANFLSSGMFLPEGEEIKYPPGTELCITYSTPDSHYILKRTAYICENGKPYQTSPIDKAFENIAQFIDHNNRLQRARITVTLPETPTPKQQRVAEMEDWLQEDGQKYLPLPRKITMIYRDFDLKSRVVLTHDKGSYTCPVWYEAYQGSTEIIGEFIRIKTCELEIQDTMGIWQPVAACEDRAYFRNLLVDNLKEHVKDGNLLFRLSWDTSQGRKSAKIQL